MKKLITFVLIIFILSSMSLFSKEYDYKGKFVNGLAFVELDDKWGMIDRIGREIVPLKYDAIDESGFVNGLVAVMLDNKWGFIDKKGREIISPKYDAVKNFVIVNRVALANVMLNNEWSYINKSGEDVILKPDDVKLAASKLYHYIGDFKDGVAAVNLNNKWGFIDETGREIVPPKYDGVSKLGFIEETAYVKLNGKWGYVDKDGSEIVPPKYDAISDKGFVDGLVKVSLNNRLGFVDKSGKEVIPPKYDAIGRGDFSDGVVYVVLNKKWGVLDRDGKEIVPVEYDEVGECGFTEGLLPVMLYEQKISEDEKVSVLSHGSDFSLGPMRTKKETSITKTSILKNRWGFVDKSGKVVIPIIYDAIGERGFVDGVAAVEQNGKWGGIDKTNRVVVPIKYDAYAEGKFVDGVAPVKVKSKIPDKNLDTNLPLEIVVEQPIEYDLSWLDKERLNALIEYDARFADVNFSSSQIKEAYLSMLKERNIPYDRQQEQYESTSMSGVRKFIERPNNSRESGGRSLQVKGTELMPMIKVDRQEEQKESTDMSGVKKFIERPNNSREGGGSTF